MGSEQIPFYRDYSTINFEQLATLPLYQQPDSHCISKHEGSGCYGDPPGFPTYFLRSIYTRHGNTPSKGPQYILALPGQEERAVPKTELAGDTGEASRARFNALMHRLWKALPLDHPRTITWEQKVYVHPSTHYRGECPTSRDGGFFFPVPAYELHVFQVDERFSD